MKYDRDEVLNRWKRGDTSDEIAAALRMAGGETVRTIVQRARRLGDARATTRDQRSAEIRGLRVHSIYPASCAIGRKLTAEAGARGIGVNELVDRLIRVAVSDDMIGSILDDGMGA